ncbi:hypothetical protein M422DRAFT_268827 [Sphaerobolus stellatus SS14]|uniref:Uncharacterized protein n=1 Tax=Sphaerobolus stellatus (strain SS14) TaxID=990650 RepID=A0A0C9TJ96_SPHS4|nr:hypothetical protein M422DRAFT_268827 [Sphaerobolus stellatus SS14]
MSHHRGHRRAQAEELSAMDIEDSEPTTGDLTNSPSRSVDPQQSLRMLPSEHLDDPHAQAYESLTAPSRVQSPSRVGVLPRTATQGLSPSRLAGVSGTAHRGSPSPPRVASITATQGHYSPRGIERRSESCSDPGRVSPTRGDTEEHFIIPASEVVVLRQEYSEFITLKDNTEVVLAEAMEAMEQLNTVFSRVRASMNRMSLRMKELFLVPANQASGKTLEPDQMAMIEPAPVSGAEECAGTTRSRIPGDQYSRAPLSRNITEDSPQPAHGEQGDDSQPRHSREAHTVYARDTPKAQGIPESIECSRHSIADPQSIDMNALREEIKATISATIKDKLCSDADSVTTVSQSMQALDSNAQYWSDLSNKAVRRSRRALELQLNLAEEKVNNLLHEEAPEKVLLEAAWEACTIRFQLDQNSRLREAGLMPEQQVQFSANTGRNVDIPPSEVNAPFGRQSTPALSINAQLDGAVVNMTSEYSGIQQMVRQVLNNASHENEPEKSFLAKAGVKMGGTLPLTMVSATLRSSRTGLRTYFDICHCTTCLDLKQEWFYRQVERFDREVKHWDLESVMMGLQKWFMPTLSLNKVAVNYDRATTPSGVD